MGFIDRERVKNNGEVQAFITSDTLKKQKVQIHRRISYLFCAGVQLGLSLGGNYRY
jgi:hypothetical protein